MKKTWSHFWAAGVRRPESKSDDPDFKFNALGYYQFLLESFQDDCKSMDEVIAILMVMGNQRLSDILDLTRKEMYSLASHVETTFAKSKGADVG